MRCFALLIISFSPFFTFSKNRLELLHSNAMAFYDYREKVFCVLDDSSYLWKFDSKKKSWWKDELNLEIETSFASFLAEFVPMSDEHSSVYFVHGGCGVVYQLKNGHIKRHDHSFYHKNQFGGAFFMDQGEPHIYGGYGLFTCKNIITRYDTTEREWYFVNTLGQRPPAGMSNIIQKSKGCYYLFDGVKDINGMFKAFQQVWKFDPNTKRWSLLGQLNPEISNNYLHKPIGARNLSPNVSIYSDKLVKYNVAKMRYEKYPLKSTSTIVQVLEVGNLVLLFHVSSNKAYIEIADAGFWNQFKKEHGSMLVAENGRAFLLITFFLVLFLIAVSLLGYRRRRKKQMKWIKVGMNKSLVFDEFTNIEKELLQLFKQSDQNGLEISYINDLVNHDHPSIETLKKRRELVLKELRYKLAIKFNLPQEEVFIERRMETDKRMKLLFLNEQVLFRL